MTYIDKYAIVYIENSFVITRTRVKNYTNNATLNYMKTVKIVGMTHQFGNVVQTNEEAEGKYGLKPGFILERTGVHKRHQWGKFPKGESPATLAWLHANTLLSNLGLTVDDIGAVFGSSNILSIPSQAHQFAHAGGIKNKMVVPAGYGCGGYYGAMQFMHLWLMSQKEGTRAILVLTDSPTSMVKEYKTGILFSDALHVSIWSNDPTDKGLVVEQPWLAMAEGDITALSLVDGCWEMDGSAISKFALDVPRLVMERMNIDDLGRFDIVPHQPNPKLLENFERTYDAPFYSKVVRNHGNPTCSGVMIALEHFLQEGESTRPILAIGFGDSLSYGAMIVRR